MEMVKVQRQNIIDEEDTCFNLGELFTYRRKESMIRKWMIILTALFFVGGSLLLITSCGGTKAQQEEVTPVTEEKPKSAEPAPTTTPATTPTTTPTTPSVSTPASKPIQPAQPSAPSQQKLPEDRTPIPATAKPVAPEAVPPAFPSANIYFEFDKADLKPEGRVVLGNMAEWLIKNPGYFLRIEGHCDERGTNEYNLALGERRALVAERFLNALGVPASRTTSLSYGEERPVDPGHNEDAWAKNRRDEFTLLK